MTPRKEREKGWKGILHAGFGVKSTSELVKNRAVGNNKKIGIQGYFEEKLFCKIVKKLGGGRSDV